MGMYVHPPALVLEKGREVQQKKTFAESLAQGLGRELFIRLYAVGPEVLKHAR